MEPEEVNEFLRKAEEIRRSRMEKLSRRGEKNRILRKEAKKTTVVGEQDKRPDLNGCENFQAFLEKYPICNEIYLGKSTDIGFSLNKETLIKKILDFFQDQGIDKYAYKIIFTGDKNEDRDLRSQLEDLNISKLRDIPKRFYDSICKGETRLDDRVDQGIITALSYGVNPSDLLVEMGMDPTEADVAVRQSTTSAQLARKSTMASAKKIRKKPKTERNTKRQKRKRRGKKKKKSQKGGFPCLTCLSPIFATAAGLGTSGIMMSSSSSSSNVNGRKSVKRKEKYQITKNGKTHKREFKQMNKRVYDGKKMSEYDNLNEANEAYNSLIKKCKSKGFQKC